jgi:exopolysaccharide biosynthesis WecB/TagA/CpsF family protein
MTALGVVAIGRNEGERLRRCLDAILAQIASVPCCPQGTLPVVYVDSGSTDGSAGWARSRGVTVVELDRSAPFTAARARNEGLARLLEAHPGLAFVQFVDGDCEIAPGWLARGLAELGARPDAAVVCGRRRERFPGASVYNRLCDMEWDTPVGEAQACGGDALFRVSALRAAGGYRAALVAGEEPELCVRLRAAGWKVLRVAAEMTWHDAGLTRLGQWWTRNVRAGHACAEVSRLHRRGPVRLWVRESRSNWFWGLLLPLVVLAASPFTAGLGALLLLGYAVLGWRVYRSRRRLGEAPANARLYAAFCVLGKFAQASGQLRYHWGRLRARPSPLIEYKGALPSGGAVAYLVNQYPHVSHTFIRREIAGVEAAGVPVRRFSVRRTTAALVDPADREELGRTEVLLAGGAFRLPAALLGVAVTRPLRWLRAAWLAFRLGRRSHGAGLRHLVYLAEACLLLRRLRRAGVRHLHAHFGTNPAAVALLTHALGGPPFSFTIHGPEEFDRPEGLSLRDKVERAAFVVAVSEYGRSQVFRWCAHRHWDKVRVVRCGVDAAFLRGGGPPPAPTRRLVCVGRLCEQKGQLRLLEALHRLAADGVSFELVLAGDGPLRPEVERLIVRLGLQEKVQVTGWVSNEAVRKHILDARALVLPSFAEGLPVVLMEALALGRPVVSTYVAGIPELVENGVSGWLAPAGSVEALAAVLREVLETPAERLDAMGRAGAARVAELHDAGREAARLAALFRSPPPPPGEGFEPVRVCGLPLAPFTLAQTVDAIDGLIKAGGPHYVITANVHYAMLAERDPTLAAVNEKAAFLVADGMPLVWASRLKRRRLPERVTGADLFPALCARAAGRGYRVFLLGGEPGVAEEAGKRLCGRYPGLQVVGVESPPFRPLEPGEHAALVARVRAARADLLFVAFGQPRGERWLAENVAALGVPVSMQVGAALDFAAGRVPRAPRLLQRVGLEWAFRLYQEPGRLLLRYAANALFLPRLLLRDLLRASLERLWENHPLTPTPHPRSGGEGLSNQTLTPAARPGGPGGGG